jgi:uncharacterized protein (DUF1697 family)
MTIYIALLRGINVGGHNVIKMADLKRMCEAMDLSRVQTYIQSGNVLFESAEPEATLRPRIEQEIVRGFGLSVPVVLRTSAELQQLIAQCPWTPGALAEGESLSVALLPEAPLHAELPGNDDQVDAYRFAGRDIYLLFGQSIRHSKLPGRLDRLGIPATVRNWNTMTKLAALARAMAV